MRRKAANALVLAVVALLFVPVFLSPLSAAGKTKCLSCHKKLAKGKFAHQALQMGCPACHSAIDAGIVPHKKTNAFAHGLSSEQPDLCYGCHDQGLFAKNDVHPAVGMGCTGCHDPHSSKYAKLLKMKIPELCFTCHDKTDFTRKVVHPPVAAGDCMTCHSPHATDEMALLLKNKVALCLDCHPDAVHGQHAPTRQPPVSEQAAGKTRGPILRDPARPGKPFYCGSCHAPHSADNSYLFRFNAESSRDLCRTCHKM
jgi:predicted CXXCH cytochrome family protein